MKIEVIYASREEAYSKEIQLPEGNTISDAINKSGILDECPDIDLKINKVGIFSQVRELQTVLRDGDRVEIYRPLVADPKEARRKRADA